MRNDRALGEEIYNEVDPSSSVFAGHMIDPKDWKNDFPMFLCNCARNAKAKGYDHFGVNNFGEKTKKIVFFLLFLSITRLKIQTDGRIRR